MVQKGSASVLERKFAAANEVAAGSGRSALRALRLALARTAKDLFDMPLAVIGAKQARCEQDRIAGFLADNRLLVLLDGAQGMAGAVSLDAACVAALIQQQTMGRVSGTAIDRVFTGTDAALAEPLIETLLARAANLADAPEDQYCLTGFRFGARVEDTRSLLLALEADRFRVYDLTIDIAEGAAQGAICLLLPDLPLISDSSGKMGKGGALKGPQLGQAFGVMHADLTAVIGRLRIPLTDLTSMQSGDVLPLMQERLEATELITINGQAIACGRLGQINGLRALRLNETRIQVDPEEQPVEDRFATRIAAPVAEQGDQSTLDGVVSPPVDQGGGESAGLPVAIDEEGGRSEAEDQEERALDILGQMTPEEAVAEISQLAGLGAENLNGG